MTEKKMLPEVEAFITALDSARAAWNAAVRELGEMYPLRYRHGNETESQQYEAHDCQFEEYRQRYVRIVDEAWERLSESDDKLVAWIGANCKDHENEVTRVLRALPATIDELNDIAADAGWCSTWDRLRDTAEDAGVLPGATARTPAYRALLVYIREEFDPGVYAAGRIRDLMDSLVAEAQAGTAVAS